ncbi:MAG: response regulator [Chthoniobacteraceae bacterium]
MQRRILIIDDEPGFTRLIKLTLEGTGKFLVREENNGLKALQTAQEFKPDIIFLDIVMPQMDGGDVAKEIKTDPALRTVPVIFLTAIASKKEEEEGKHINGYPFIAKPVSLETIVNCVDTHLGNAAGG